MATTKTRKTPKANIAALRAEAEGLQGTTFATLKPKLATLVGALENLQRGNSATETQRKAVADALQDVKTDPSFQYSNGVTSALDFIKDLKRLQGEGGLIEDRAKPAEAAQETLKPAAIDKIEAVESISSRILGIRQTMDSKVNQDVFELTGNFVTIANKWAGSQTRNASKPAKLAVSNLALSEAIWELKELGEDLLAEYGLKEIVGELLVLHPAQKPENPHPRARAVEIAPRVVPVALDPRNAVAETPREKLSDALKAFSETLEDGAQKTAFLELADAYAAYETASDTERNKIGGPSQIAYGKIQAAIATITDEGAAKDMLRKCVNNPDFRNLTTELETADLFISSPAVSDASLTARLAAGLEQTLEAEFGTEAKAKKADLVARLRAWEPVQLATSVPTAGSGGWKPRSNISKERVEELAADLENGNLADADKTLEILETGISAIDENHLQLKAVLDDTAAYLASIPQTPRAKAAILSILKSDPAENDAAAITGPRFLLGTAIEKQDWESAAQHCKTLSDYLAGNTDEALSALLQRVHANYPEIQPLPAEADLQRRLEDRVSEQLSDIFGVSRVSTNNVFDDLRKKLLSEPFFDNLNYSHGIDQKTVESVLAYLEGHKDGERAAAAFLKDFNGNDCTTDERGFKNGFTKCALLLISTNHLMRNKINKLDHHEKSRETLVSQMAASFPPSLPEAGAALHQAVGSGTTEDKSAAEELNFDALLREYVGDDRIADDVLFYIENGTNSEKLKLAFAGSFAETDNADSIRSKLDDIIELVENSVSLEELEAKLLAGIDGTDPELSYEEKSYLNHTLLAKVTDEDTIAALNAAIAGRKMETAETLISQVMAGQRQLIGDEIYEVLKTVESTKPAIISEPEADADADAEVETVPAIDALRAKLAQMKEQITLLPDSSEKSDVEKAFSAFTAETETFAAVNVSGEDPAENIKNYRDSRVIFDNSWKELCLAVEKGRNVYFDDQSFVELDASLDVVDLAYEQVLAEQSNACELYQNYAHGTAQKLARGPVRPSFGGKGNKAAAEKFKHALASYGQNMQVLDAVELALSVNGRGIGAWKSYDKAPYARDAYDTTKALMAALYGIPADENPLNNKAVKAHLQFLAGIGRRLEEANIDASETAERAAVPEEALAAVPAAGEDKPDETDAPSADASKDSGEGDEAAAAAAAAAAEENEDLRKKLLANVRQIFKVAGRVRNFTNLDMLRKAQLPQFSNHNLKLLVSYTDIIVGTEDKYASRNAIKTLEHIWFTPITGRDNSAERTESWEEINDTINNAKDDVVFGADSRKRREDLESAVVRLCIKAGMDDRRMIRRTVRDAVTSAGYGKDISARNTRLADLITFAADAEESAPKDDAELRTAHFAAFVTNIRALVVPEVRAKAESTVGARVAAYRKAKHDAAMRAQIETLNASLDELIADENVRKSIQASELAKLCRTPAQVHAFSRYIDSALASGNAEEIENTTKTLQAALSKNPAESSTALRRIFDHVQKLLQSEAQDASAKSMAERVGPANTDARSKDRREPVLPIPPASNAGDGDTGIDARMSAAMGTARAPVGAARPARQPSSLSDGMDARRTHLDPARPAVGEDIYEETETPEGGKIRKALAKFFINEPEGLKEDSKRWRNHVVAASIKTTAVFTTAGLSIAGVSAGVGGAVANLSGYALLAGSVSLLGLPIYMPALIGGVIVGGTVGYLSNKIVKAYYNARLDTLAIENGELTRRQKKKAVKAAKKAKKQEIKREYAGITNWPKRRYELAKFTTAEIARNFPDAQTLKAFFRKETLKDVSLNMAVGASVALLARTSITLTTFLATGDTEAAVAAWTSSRIRGGLDAARQGVGGIWKAASTGDVSDLASLLAGGNALIGEFLTDPQFLRARTILENIAAGDTTATGELRTEITDLLAALDKRDAASLPALAELLEKLADEGGERRLAHGLGQAALAKFAGITDPAFADGKTALAETTARIRADIDAAEALRAAARLAAADVAAVTDALPRVTALARVDQIVARLPDGADKTALTDALRDLRAGKIDASVAVIERLAALNRGGLATELRNQLVTQLETKLGVDANKGVITRLKGMTIAVDPAAEAIADAATTAERFAAFIKHDAGMQRVLDSLQNAMDKAPDAATKAHLRSILENVRGPRPNPALVLGAIDTYGEWMKFNANGTYSPLAGRPDGLPGLAERRALAQAVRTSMREHLMSVTEGDAKAQKYLKLSGEERMPTDAQRIGSIAVTRVNPVNLAETLGARGYNVVSGAGDRIIISVPRGESARLPIFGEMNPAIAKTFGMASATDSIQYPVRIWPTDTLLGKVANSIQLNVIRGGFSPVEFDVMVDQAQQGHRGSIEQLKAMAERTLGGNGATRESRALLAELRKFGLPQPRPAR